MPMVLPAIVGFAAAGGTVAGVAAALTGAAGFATFATVAGGFMASAGMLTGNKTLTKIGSVLGIVGAVSGIASSLASGASNTAAGEVAKEAATDVTTESATEALKSEMANTAVGETIGQTAGEATAKVGTEGVASLGGESLTAAPNAVAGAGGAPLQLADAGQTTNLLELARDGSDYGLMQRGLESASISTDFAQNSALSKIAEAGQQIKDKSVLDAIMSKVSGAGQWAKQNKEMLTAGGTLLQTGMQSMQQGNQFDQQMNLLEERRRRLNQPVVLGAQSAQPIKIGG